jgi:hypothetical protein
MLKSVFFFVYGLWNEYYVNVNNIHENSFFDEMICSQHKVFLKQFTLLIWLLIIIMSLCVTCLMYSNVFSFILIHSHSLNSLIHLFTYSFILILILSPSQTHWFIHSLKRLLTYSFTLICHFLVEVKMKICDVFNNYKVA